MTTGLIYKVQPVKAQLDVPRIKQLLADRDLSQSELARRSGVSRATIARLLARSAPTTRLSTARKLAGPLGVGGDALNRRAVPTAYRDAVAREHAILDFTGLGVTVAGEPMPMDRGYVPLRVCEWRGGGGHAARCATPPVVQRKPQDFPLAAGLARSRRVLLLGDPGSGKTTALRHLARAYARQRAEEHDYPPASLVPVYVRAADWAEFLSADEQTSLLAAALGPLRLPAPAETLRWLDCEARRGEMIVLLDGLDEVADPDTRGAVIEAMRAFLADHPRTRMVITSRTVGFGSPNLGAAFETFEVRPLGPDAIMQFAAEWLSFRHGHTSARACPECAKETERLRHAITQNPRLATLAGNPLMLTVLALLQEAGADLPQRRWDLYRKITEALLFSWDGKRRAAVRGEPDRALGLDDREVQWILESIALKMQKEDWTLVGRWWLLEEISRFLSQELSLPHNDARAQADTLLWSLQQRAGILVERVPERFGFSHLALQEYFAAGAVLAAEDPVEELRPHFYHPRWQEVVRLASSHLNRRRVPELFRAILDDPDPTGRFLSRGLLLVLACLADGAPLHDSSLLGELQERVAALGRSRWSGIALDALRYVPRLFGTRLDGFARQAREQVRAAAWRACACQAAPPSHEPSAALIACLTNPDEPERVRAACLQALEGVLHSLEAELHFVTSLLAGPPDGMLTHVAAQVLAGYASDGRVPWAQLPIEGIEHALMSLAEPCPHALSALRALVDAREIRRLGVPREKRIERALAEFRERTQAMFIFGSSARGEQSAESDIDLMVIGDVSLRELTPGLKKAEHELGRQINAVIYSPHEWRERCRARDSFAMNVLDDRKVFILGDRDELRAVGS